MSRGLANALGFACLMVTLALADDVRAQDAECFPPCRSGFVCLAGECVSACNPPCPEGEACQDGECVVPQSSAPAASAPPPPVAPSPALASVAEPPPQEPAPQTGWVTIPPGAGPPSAATNDRRAELRRIRKQLHLSAYVSPGFLYIGAPTNDGVEFVSGDFEVSEFGWSGSYGSGHFAFAIGLGLGIRYNFAYVVGFQARAYFDLMPAMSGYVLIEDDIPTSCSPTVQDCEASGIGFRTGADVSFRFGPFAQAFPMYIGLGGFAGGRQISAASDLADYNSFVPELGGLAELGFIFGEHETYDLGVRGEMGPKTDGESFTVAVYLSFGLALASSGP